MISTYYFTPEFVLTKLYFLFVLTVFFLRRSEELVETAAVGNGVGKSTDGLMTILYAKEKTASADLKARIEAKKTKL
jgi:hypothetical protein